MPKIFSYIILLRPLNFIITFFVVVVGILIAAETVPAFGIFLLAGLSAALTASAGNIINDIFDIESDKINHPKRPLPSGIISRKEALLYYFFLTIAALIFSFRINFIALFLVLISSIILFFYSYKLKGLPFTGNFVVAFMTGLTFIYAGAVVENTENVFLPALFAFLINYIRELVKDIEDVEGDLKASVKSIPIKFGIPFTKKIILFLSVFLFVITFHPFVYKYYRIEFFILVMVLVNPVLLFVVKSLFEDHSKQNLNKISFLLKLNMIFGLIAIYLGK